ncbi:MAG: hypothetical protein AB1432_06245 [Bacteroidota bacterium]
MLKKFLTNVEEKYVFNVSHYFWHIVVGLISLGIVVGVFLLIYGVFPTFKATVEKEKYPPLVEVTYSDVNNALLGKKKEFQPEPIDESYAASAESTSDEYYKIYENKLDTLKQLIPPEKYSWDAAGYWYYPYGERYSSYRSWIETDIGIYRRLEQSYENSSADSYNLKADLLTAFINLVKLYRESNRITVLKNAANICQHSVNKSVALIDKLAQSYIQFGESDLSYLSTLSSFAKSNPREGENFINLTLTTVSSFDKKNRISVLEELKNNFYRYYNTKIEQQIEATNDFLTFIKKFEVDKQVEALSKYYEISVIKNRNREQEINRIEDDYSQKLSQAEMEYLASQAEKSDLRIKGVYGVASGLVLIAFIALLLVLLSIQRYLKSIYMRLDKGAISS